MASENVHVSLLVPNELDVALRALHTGPYAGKTLADIYRLIVEDLRFGLEQSSLPNFTAEGNKGHACKAAIAGLLGKVYLTMAHVLDAGQRQENLKQAIADGYNMIILGNDMWHFQKALKELVNDQVAPVRKELLGE